MMVSLPAKWIKENSLHKGDGIDIEGSENELVISLQPTGRKTESAVKLIGLTESSIRTLITNTYRKGYD